MSNLARSSRTLKPDLLIIGGGVAGLWCLRRAAAAGYSCLLLENGDLGGAQTVASQGIIHGGTKYSLTGRLSSATESIAAMPARWLAAICGEGEIDLRQTQILSNTHYLWSTHSLSAKVTTFLASKAMKNKANRLVRSDYPEAFRHPAFKGNLYALNETVVDVPSLIRNLAQPLEEHILKLDPLKDATLEHDHTGIHRLHFTSQGLSIEPRQVLITCGEAYNGFREQLGFDHIRMQKRPLHMVVLEQRSAPPIFAHAIGASAKPLLTITSHRSAHGTMIWYLGGLLAEEGVAKDEPELIVSAEDTVARLLPWITLDQPRWRAHRVNRAEPEMQGHLRPDTASLQTQGNCLVGWPAKLALAPQLSDMALAALLPPSGLAIDRTELADLPHPVVARALWG
jgi:glycerol-3-phosphate dehydrogenase